MERLRQVFVSGSALAVFAFLYFPLLVVIIFSFSDLEIMSFPIQSFSARWYHAVFENQQLMGSMFVSFTVAIVATFIALIIGLPSAFALYKYDYPAKKWLDKIILMPITLPGIITGVAMLSFYPKIGIKLSLTAVTFGHITFLISIVVTQMLGRFKKLDPFLEQAAYDLGATPWQAFRQVILPNIQTAIIGAVLLCLVLSMDEIPVTYFLLSRDNTLPIEIYGMIRREVTPEINAIASIVFIISSSLILLSLRFTKEIKTQRR